MRSIRPHLGLAHISRYARLPQRHVRPHTSINQATRWCSCSAPKFQEAPAAPDGSETTVDVPVLSGPESLHEYYKTSIHSPGSPIFTTRGSYIFNKLVSFLRTQYPRYGFQEVVTPTIYKKSLWEKSGHWDNYAKDMYAVHGRSAGEGNEPNEQREHEEFGLKPMNCPGHCILFSQEQWSYRDLPVRFADFSPLHRNEVSGSLSGLTRVRRFHQDDGHIFCTPSQIKEEIEKQLSFVTMVYQTFGLSEIKFVHSTRPTDGSAIGSYDQWDSAQAHLESALNASGQEWELNPGDGAFYGPKIDILIRDPTNRSKWLQTATIQLDFQLPIRFDLKYDAPPSAPTDIAGSSAPASEDSVDRPVLIHRAIYGSIERFMHLLLSTYRGTFPLWLSPRPIILLTMNDTAPVVEYVKKVRDQILGGIKTAEESRPRKWIHSNLSICDVDTRPISIARKVAEARMAGYNFIGTIGKQEVENRMVALELNKVAEQSKDRTEKYVGQWATGDLQSRFGQGSGTPTWDTPQIKESKGKIRYMASPEALGGLLNILSNTYL